MTAELVERGRAAYDNRAWQECWAVLSEADSAGSLAAPDLMKLAVSGYLVGNDDAAIDAFSRAYTLCLDSGDLRGAARSAFYLSFLLSSTNEPARSSAWAARAHELVEQHQLGGAEAALHIAYQARMALEAGDAAGALEIAARAVQVGRDTGDAEVRTLGLLTAAHARIELRQFAEASACIDEVMLAVSGSELPAPVAGVAYCSVIAACFRSHDVARAREWTAALSSWCDAQPGLVPFRGVCLVHRAELMTMSGNWAEAQLEVARARDQVRQPVVGEAYYRQGELHRLRGEFADAESAYRRANTWGRQPEPGLVRLRVAQGRLDTAAVTVRRLHSDVKDPTVRADVLAACVDVGVRVQDVELARAASVELDGIAADVDSRLLRAMAARATGQVELADGRCAEGLAALRRSWRIWQDLEMPYEGAVTRVLIGECLQLLGDGDAAQMEFDAAQWWFTQLGAEPDAARVATLARGGEQSADRPPPTGGLTDREVQVLRLVASGGTNRAIAAELFLSEKTVARHISNIFTKLGVSSRSAATAYAYDHGLVART